MNGDQKLFAWFWFVVLAIALGLIAGVVVYQNQVSERSHNERVRIIEACAHSTSPAYCITQSVKALS